MPLMYLNDIEYAIRQKEKQNTYNKRCRGAPFLYIFSQRVIKTDSTISSYSFLYSTFEIMLIK